MWGRVIFTYLIGVGIPGATAYVMFPWFNLQAVVLLAVFSALSGGIALAVLSMTGRLGTGGGGGSAADARASVQSKGARGDDR